MEKKLFVGNISFNTQEKDLENLFKEAGEVVSCVIIKDKFSGRSKGFGFVEMGSEADAKKAVDALNNKELDGRPITVNEARPQEDRPKRNY
jgi:cold-inducible RNA-binding protein